MVDLSATRTPMACNAFRIDHGVRWVIGGEMVMPVTASTLVHRAPAWAWTPKVTEPQGRGLPAILGETGLSDRLKGRPDKGATLAARLRFDGECR
jgi:hypothetical protein